MCPFGRPAARAPRRQPSASAPAPQIYVPRLPGIPNEYPYLPDAFGLSYEDVEIIAADGVRPCPADDGI